MSGAGVRIDGLAQERIDAVPGLIRIKRGKHLLFCCRNLDGAFRCHDGAAIGGFLADVVGFNAINWMGVIAAVGSVAAMFILVYPAARKQDEAEPAKVAAE